MQVVDGAPLDDDGLGLAAAKALENVQGELGVHASASRAILTHLCQRLARLEGAVHTLEFDSRRLRADTHRDSQEVRTEVRGVTQRVETMSSQLNEYASAMDLFQNEMHAHKRSLSWLADTVKDDKDMVKQVDEKVDQQREALDNRITELHLKIEEIPRALAALQDTRRGSTFTFRTADDKLSLQSHLQRTGEGSFRTGSGAPYTDLTPFTIPDDMRLKVEARIREREAIQSAEQARAELADAYRRLQLAAGGNPRVGELRLQVDQCQEEIKHAFSLIRTSNLQLYACCEAKAERMDMTTMQRDIRQMRDRLQTLENGQGVSLSPTKISNKASKAGTTASTIHELSTLLIGSDSTHTNSSSATGKVGASLSVIDGRALQVTNAQVPELRVSLLELSRNLNLLKHRWKKRRWGPNGGGGSVNPLVLTHLEKLVAMINDAYSTTAEEPVDLPAVSRHVDKVARVLGSDFSVQILSLLGGRSADRDVDEIDSNKILQLQSTSTSVTAPIGGARDLARALCRYSDAFSDLFFRNETEVKNTAGIALEQCAKATRSLDRVVQDVDELTRKQEALEDAMLSVKAAMYASPSSPSTSLVSKSQPSGSLDPASDLRHVSEELQQLKQRVGEMSQTFATEHALQNVLSQLEQCRQALQRPLSGSTPTGILASASYSPLSIAAPTAISIVRRRSADGTSDSLLSSLVLDPNDERLRSQPKLDPLQVHKMAGEPRPNRMPGPTTLSGASRAGSGALGKIQIRSQMMRPKSNRQHRS